MSSAAGERPLVGAVLAGGRSRRYGSPKAAVLVGGRTMLERVLGALAAAGADPLLVVGDPARAGGVAEGAGGTPGPGDEGVDVPGGRVGRPGLASRIRRIPDRPAARGPLGGLRAALLEARSLGRSGVLLVGCDLPLLPPELLRLVAAAFGGDRVVVPESPGPLGYEPLASAFPVSLLPRVEEVLEGEDPSLQRLIDDAVPHRLPLELVREVVEPERAFLNVNTPSDRRRAEELLRGVAGG